MRKNSQRVIAPVRGDLNSFLTRLMEPLSTDVLVDTHYNTLARNARKMGWWKAEVTTRLFDAKIKLADAQYLFDRDVLSQGEDDIRWGQRDSMVDQYRQAVAQQIRTPAPDLLSVGWKKRHLANSFEKFRFISKSEIEAAIADDEAFLAAHPLTKQPRRKRGGSSRG